MRKKIIPVNIFSEAYLSTTMKAQSISQQSNCVGFLTEINFKIFCLTMNQNDVKQLEIRSLRIK